MNLWQSTLTTPPDPAATELRGRVAHVRHTTEREDGSSWVVATLVDGATVKGECEPGRTLTAGEHCTFLGRWREHVRWGWAFEFDAILDDIPTDTAGVVSWLAKHATGIGPVTAARLVEAYGTDAVRVMCEDWQRVAADGHLSPGEAQAAAESLAQAVPDPALREAHVSVHGLLRGSGIWGKAQAAAVRRWKLKAPEIIRRDPFRLMTEGLPSCGFVRCDRLYARLDRPLRRLKRQSLAAWWALASADGDTWLGMEAALKAVRSQIGDTVIRDRRALALLYRAGQVDLRTSPDGKVWIADRAKATAERLVARRVRELLSQPPTLWPTVEACELEGHQAEQVALALRGRICLLTGSPGTGKTHCAAAICRALVRAIGHEQIGVCAPTGKAAVRITQKLAEARLPLKASTVHRLLGVMMGASGEAEFQAGERNPLTFRVIVMDETSICDCTLMAALLGAAGPDCHVLLVGDPHQLPPVGHGAPLRDLIAAGVPCATLTEIRRNAGRIVETCHQIKDGLVAELPAKLEAWPGENLIHLAPVKGPQKDQQRLLLERLDSLYDWLPAASAISLPSHGQECWGDDTRNGGLATFLPHVPYKKRDTFDLVDDVQVICARNATRQALNRHLQQRLNAAGQKAPQGQCRAGDKVICLKNGWCPSAGNEKNPAQVYVANGDIGRVRGFRGKMMAVELAAPTRLVWVPLGKASQEQTHTTNEGETAKSWDLAYCVTCHKYQGSEVPVAIVVAEPAGKLSCREWIYTALSRARELCLLVGERKDLAAACRRVTLPDRRTFLVELLTGSPSPQTQPPPKPDCHDPA